MVKVKMFSKEGELYVKKLKQPNKDKSALFSDTYSISISIEDIEKYKIELLDKKKRGKLREGTYSNRSTSINNFVEELLKLKNLDKSMITQQTILKITASDLYEIFKKWYETHSEHTFRVYVNGVKIALEDILFKNNILLSRRIPPEVFNYKLYYRNLSKSAKVKKGDKLKSFSQYEKYKAVSPQRIKNAYTWLNVLMKEKVEKNRMHLITWYRLKIALLLLTFTGARSTEIVDLEYNVKTRDGEMIHQIDLKNALIYFIRNKVRDENNHRTVTPVFISEPLLTELKIYKRNFGVNKLFNWKSLDKIIKDYFTPSRKFNEEELKILKKKYTFLQGIPLDKPIVTVSLFRKYLDNWLEQKSLLFLQDQIHSRYATSIQELFGGKEGLSYIHLNKLKNFFMGRVEGIDYVNYDAFFENRKLFNTMKNLHKWFMRGFLDNLEPEILWVLEPQTIGKLVGSSSSVQKGGIEQGMKRKYFEQNSNNLFIKPLVNRSSKANQSNLNISVQTF